MQSILEHTVKSLHEYNSHPDTKEDEQLTILDGLRMLPDLKFRNQVLLRVNDSFIIDWWSTILPQWSRETRSQAQAPVQTRLAYYSSSKKARAILGQPVSTINLRQVIREGGVLLVSTAQATAGRDVSALVGASLLNLVDAVIREQGQLPPEQRRGALVLVVFDDFLAEGNFLGVARVEMERTRVDVPLWVSYSELLEEVGPVGKAWRGPEVLEPMHVFT